MLTLIVHMKLWIRESQHCGMMVEEMSGGRLAAPMASAAMVPVSEKLLGSESTLTQM